MGKRLEQALAFCVCSPVPNWLADEDNQIGFLQGSKATYLYPFKFNGRGLSYTDTNEGCVVNCFLITLQWMNTITICFIVCLSCFSPCIKLLTIQLIYDPVIISAGRV